MADTSTPQSGNLARLHSMVAADTDPAAANVIGNIVSIGSHGREANVASFHHHGNPWEQKIATTFSQGQIELEITRVGTDISQTQMEAAFAARSTDHYAITTTPAADDFETGHIARFQAIVSKLEISTPQDDRVMLNVTLDLTGTPTSAALSA